MDVIFDIDGTLANAEHRLHYIVEPSPSPYGWKKDWDKFLCDEEVAKDTPIEPIFELLSEMAFSSRFTVIFITGQKESSREMTSAWIAKHIRYAEYHPYLQSMVSNGMLMRSENDRRPSHEVKLDLLDQVRKLGYDPKLVFEDRADDAKMWREAGLLCCQVAEGNY